MQLNLTTPALLFPAISLLLLAYTNRFLTLATLIRNLHSAYHHQPEPHIRAQIDNLRQRVKLIQDMQTLGVSSFFSCVLTMLLVFIGQDLLANIIFGLSLLLLLASLWLSLREISISVGALTLQLHDLDAPSVITKSAVDPTSSQHS
ncbi:MAG: DUF2721 domain-containing protein [Deinococcota bacterium]